MNCFNHDVICCDASWKISDVDCLGWQYKLLQRQIKLFWHAIFRHSLNNNNMGWEMYKKIKHEQNYKIQLNEESVIHEHWPVYVFIASLTHTSYILQLARVLKYN